MTRRILIAALLMLRLSAQCIEVAGDRIRARDISTAVPGFAAVSAETVVGLSPLVGARRTLRAAELYRLAASHGANLGEIRDLCIVRQSHTLTVDEIVAAMSTSLNDPDVVISISDYTRGPLPAGTVEFPVSALSAPQGDPGASMWRGRIRSASGRTAPVWALARITKRVRLLVATRTIPPAHTITADDVELRDMDVFPKAISGCTDSSEAIGKEASRTILAGSVIQRQAVRPGTAVKRGESVRVAVRSGSVAFFFDGKAETTARAGDGILFRNPLNGRFVRAVVREDGTAEIELKRERNVPLPTTPNRGGDPDLTRDRAGKTQDGTAAR